MGLTRIKAGQISDIDYKQAVRVITLSDVTLSGGAPNTVDGVNLAANDRILVAGQSTGNQNGLYYVQTLGTGATGTWVRTSDGNENGEIQAGMIVMVTEGDQYKDSQWKLTTNDPIVIGSSNLVFEQNSAYAFGNIYANGIAVLANAVGGTIAFSAGNNIAITGNNTSKVIQFDVTGISLNSISNGTSNVNVVSSGGNVTVGVGGTNNVAVFSTTGEYVTGVVSASGNITGGNLLTSGNIQGNYISGNGSQLSGINAFGTISVSGQGNVVAGGLNAGVTFIAGPSISIVTDAGNDSVTFSYTTTAGSIFATGGDMGTITEAVTASEDLGSITSAVTTSYDLGQLGVTGVVSNDDIINNTITGNKLANDFSYSSNFTVTGNLTSGNLIAANIATAGVITATGNIMGGNVISSGNVYINNVVVPNQDQVVAYIFAF